MFAFEAQCALGDVPFVRSNIKLFELKVQRLVRLGQFGVDVALEGRPLVNFLMSSGWVKLHRRCGSGGIYFVTGHLCGVSILKTHVLLKRGSILCKG